MRTLRTLLAVAGVAAVLAGSGHAQYREDHGQSGGGRVAMPSFGRGGPTFSPQRMGPPERMAPPNYSRGGPGYGPPKYGGPAYPGGRGPTPQRFTPRAYTPYPSPYREEPAFGGEWREQQEFLRQGVRQGQLAPLGRVISGIRERTPGRQLDAGLEQMGSRLVYRVRWMTAQGRRVDYIVDAATGAIVSER